MRVTPYDDEYCYKKEKKSMKKWYRSKVLWTNFIGIAVIIATAAGVDSESIAAIITAEASILGVINLILRLITKQGLEK